MCRVRGGCQLLVCVWLAAFAATVAGGESATMPSADDRAPAFQQTVKPFLRAWCSECHGAKHQKGDRRFDRLTGIITDDNALIELQDIVDQLNLSGMPPSDAPQPPGAEVRSVVRVLTELIRHYQDARKDAVRQPVLRRLNAREYRNAVRDLLHLDVRMFDPTGHFPRDQTSGHLDNIGETLVTSGYLLARYLESADRIVEKVLHPRKQPAVQTWRFDHGFRQQPEIDQVFRRVNNFEWMTLFDVPGADKHEGAYGPIHAFADGVPYDGEYEIRLRAQAVHRVNPYAPEFLGRDPSEPFRLGIVPGDRRAGPLHKPQPVEPLLAEIELADEMKWYTVRIPLDAGLTPRFTFQNGLMDVRNLWARLIREYPDGFPKKSRGIVQNRFNAISLGKLPQIQIHEIEISGPYFDEWPTASHRALLGDSCRSILETGEMSREQMRQSLGRLATRAFRRPVSPERLTRLLQIADVRMSAGRQPLEAYADAVKAVLCSPDFLYVGQLESVASPSEESPPPGEVCGDAFALAERLSLFLWSSLPDDRLRNLAGTGSLHDAKTLSREVDRLLADPRSDAFVNGFLDGWLGLRNLGSMPPDRTQFPRYYRDDLERAMRRETFLFTRYLLDNDLSISNFLDSDFTFVNRALARHYGIQPPAGSGFERVVLEDRRRGGLLGQASILTVTANGIDTSPVVRGVWLLEQLLGTPPSPPPPDVEPLDPDIRGATTIREQLEKHRESPACYDCHRRIDPMGWALENFDPVGRWRTSYGKRPIDASAELPDGQAYRNIVEFKALLLNRRTRFVTALTRKLLEYATGRHMTVSDRPEIDRIVEQMAEGNDGFRSLIHAVVQSRPFTGG